MIILIISGAGSGQSQRMNASDEEIRDEEIIEDERGREDSEINTHTHHISVLHLLGKVLKKIMEPQSLSLTACVQYVANISGV